MPWFNVDDGFALHRKARAAGNAALGLWVRAGSYCAQHLTDGHIDADIVDMLGTRKQADRLVKAGLWEADETGYQFHEWGIEHRNPMRAQVEKERAAAATRKQKSRDEKGAFLATPQVNGHRHSGVTGGVTPTLSSPSKDKDHGPTMGAASDLDVRESGPAPSGPGSVDAMRLVTLAIGNGLTAGTRTSLAFQVQRLRADATDVELDAALKRWDARTGIGPALLGAMIDDIRKEARGATSRPPAVASSSPTDAFAEQFLRGGQPAPPVLRAITGGNAC